MLVIRLDQPWAECCICGDDTPMTHSVAYCCEPTHDEIGAESSAYPGHIVGGRAACQPCHDRFYGIETPRMEPSPPPTAHCFQLRDEIAELVREAMQRDGLTAQQAQGALLEAVEMFNPEPPTVHGEVI